MDINSFLGYIFSIVEFLNLWRSEELSFCKQFRAVSYEKQETICVLEKIGKKCFFDKGSPWHSFILFSFVSYVI